MDDGSGGDQDIRGKVSMKTLFGRRNLKKDGTEGKVGRAPNSLCCSANHRGCSTPCVPQPGS